MTLPFAAAFLALAASGPPHLAARRVADAPKLDGRLDDPAWTKASASSDFTQKFPDEGAAPSERTSVRVIYDDEAIYVGIDCQQVGVPVVERLTRRGRQVEADWVEVDLGTRADHRSGFMFQVNAAGVLVDSLRFNDTDVAGNWDENWDARTHVHRGGWSAEIKIPLRALRFPSSAVQSWDFQVRRHISERQETDEWSFIPRSDAGEISRYGKLDELVGLVPQAPLELRPFVVGRIQRRDPASTQLASGTDATASAGLDLKWHPTQDLTWDASVNPDFAQVEADEQVLNLTNFETYYPEKRPFFLEGVDTFTTPVQLVYTRRIGRAPPVPANRVTPPFGEQLVDVPTPSTIYGASKLTGRLSDQWTIGTLQAVSAERDVDVQLADGSRVRRLAEPTTGFNVLRIKRELEGNGHIGFLGTATDRLESIDRYPVFPAANGVPAQTLCPNGALTRPRGRCFNNAYVGGLDWRWRSPDGDFVTTGQAVASTLQGGPDRLVKDGTVIHPGDVGGGVVADLKKEGGKHWVGDLYGEYNTRKLDVNDLGFDPRANNWRWRVDVEYRELDTWWILRESHARFEYFDRKNLDGLDLGSGYQLNVSGKTEGFWDFFTELHYRPTYFDDREVGDGTALERAGRLGYELELSTNPARPVRFVTTTQTQYVFGGFAFSGDAGLLVRALPQLDVEILPTVVSTFGEPRYVAPGDTPGSVVFGKLLAKSIGTVVRSTYTFTPRLSLQTFAQLFLASGHYTDLSVFQGQANGPRPVIRLADLQPYRGRLLTNPDFEDGSLNINVVLRWEYTLGSTLYLVYTRSQIPAVTLAGGEAATLSVASVRRAPAADVVVAKLSYWLPL